MMVWNSFGEFFHMGGYGLYVWGSMIVTFGLMLTEVALLKFRRRSVFELLGRNRVLEADVEIDDDEGKPA